MKERSKKAARTRREKENHEFSELAKLLPLPSNVTSQLDKASIVKLTTAYLKLRDLFPYGLGEQWGSTASNGFLKDLASFLLQSLEGFLLIIGPNLKIIYVSEGVSFYLGLSQVEMMGNNINEYVHVYDHDELKILLNHEEVVYVQNLILEEIEVARCFSLRMKCVLTKRNAGLVTDSFKVIHCRGYLKMRPIRLSPEGAINLNEIRYNVAGLVAVCNAMHPTSILELKMYSYTFMHRAELDLKFMHLDPRVKELTGYEPQQLMHESLYNFIHVSDSLKMNEDHRLLIAKGQAVTSYFRFLTHGGGWLWMQSSFIILHNSKSRQPFILAINHVLSERQYSQYLLDKTQITESGRLKCDENGRLLSVRKSGSAPEAVNKEIPKVKTESSSINPGLTNNYFQPFIQAFTCVQPTNTAAAFVGDLQPIARNELSYTAAAFENVQNSPSSLACASFGDFRSNWYTYGHSTNPFSATNTHETVYPSNIPPPANTTDDPLGHNSFYANASSFAYLGPTSDSSSSFSAYLNPNTNNNPASSSAAYSGTSYSMESGSASICNNGTFYSGAELPYYVESISTNSINCIPYGDPVHNPYLTTSVDNSKRSELNKDAARTESFLSGRDNLTKNSNNVDHISNFDSCGVSVGEMPLSNNPDDLRNDPLQQLYTISLNLYSRTIKNEEGIKDQLISKCAGSSCNAEAFNPAETLLTDPLNAPSLEITKNWVVSNDLNSVSQNMEPLDVTSDGASSATLSMPQTPRGEYSPLSAKSEFSFSDNLHNEQIYPCLNSSSSDYSSGYYEQANARHSASYCDLQSSSSIGNRKDSFDLSHLKCSSGAPLYTVL